MDDDHARRTFEAANGIVELDPSDNIYTHDADAYQRVLREAPWRRYVCSVGVLTSDPEYFQHIRISAIALLKMVLHAKSGGNIEVMGLMQGRACTETRTLYVFDAFALPVHGTETRVNAQNEAYEYMVTQLEHARAVGRDEPAIGWYHSHPGYGCWLSGIDVQTQQTNQQQDPFVAVVIDPLRTMTLGQVDIGAFRTYPDDARSDHARRARDAVPLYKAEEYGAHADKYYALDVQYFRSSLDARLFELLWQQYWTHALAQTPAVPRALAAQGTEELATRLQAAADSMAASATAVGPSGSSLTQAIRAVSRAAPDACGALADALEQRDAMQPLSTAAVSAKALAAGVQRSEAQQQLQRSLFG
ncbi:COP9 signalosome catalytic subunit rri1 [Malassezia cuniculi]|uniref:COP9 signalosome complex subunit 5 n=1 Tax=Malassezia cuniculi TaxID=948313 RepID=A0AAF0EMT0_9BASI|nr:COP9 signalosome catalytic subunit rri1 [Malassezia cuniculi]